MCSSTPKQLAIFTGKAIELLPGPKDQVFDVEKSVAHVLIAWAECLGLQFPDSIKANTQRNSAIVSARIINITDRYPPALPLYHYILLKKDFL